MQGDLIIAPDTTTWPVDTVTVCGVNDSLAEHSLPSDSMLFYSLPFEFSDTNSTALMPFISPQERHNGIIRPKDTLAESFLIALLLLTIFLIFRFISNGKSFLISILKKALTDDERYYTSNIYLKSFFPLLWIINLIIFSFAVRMYMGYLTEYPVYLGNGGIFWNVVIFVAAFWIIRHLLLLLIGKVFFTNEQTNQILSGIKLIQTIFSFSLLPLIIITEAGMQLPFAILYLWPFLFWLIPKIVQYMQVSKLFSLRNGGYLYLILYLCTLEILPVVLFVKGLFLLK